MEWLGKIMRHASEYPEITWIGFGLTFLFVLYFFVSRAIFKLGKRTFSYVQKKDVPVQDAKELSLSLVYLLHLRHRDNKKPKLILFFFAALFFGLSLYSSQTTNLSITSLVLLTLLILLTLKERLVEYRIKKGIFGTNRTEAKALIEFIIKNADDIDFTDSNGNLRPALLPEAKSATAEQPLPPFGEEASA